MQNIEIKPPSVEEKPSILKVENISESIDDLIKEKLLFESVGKNMYSLIKGKSVAENINKNMYSLIKEKLSDDNFNSQDSTNTPQDYEEDFEKDERKIGIEHRAVPEFGLKAKRTKLQKSKLQEMFKLDKPTKTKKVKTIGYVAKEGIADISEDPEFGQYPPYAKYYEDENYKNLKIHASNLDDKVAAMYDYGDALPYLAGIDGNTNLLLFIIAAVVGFGGLITLTTIGLIASAYLQAEERDKKKIFEEYKKTLSQEGFTDKEIQDAFNMGIDQLKKYT